MLIIPNKTIVQTLSKQIEMELTEKYMIPAKNIIIIICVKVCL